MKKSLLLLTLFLSLAGIAKATETTVTFGTLYSSVTTSQSLKDKSFDVDNVVTFTFGGSGIETKYFYNGKNVRFYPNNTITIKVKTGYAVSKIAFTGVSGNAFHSNVTATSGKYTVSGDNATWEGNLSATGSLTFTNGGSQIRCTGVTVTYEELKKELGDIKVSYYGGDVTKESTVTVPNGTVFNIAADNATSIKINGSEKSGATATYTATTSETVNVSATDGTATKEFSFTTEVFTAPDAPTFTVDGVSTGVENGYFYGAKLSMSGSGSIYYTTDGSTPSATDGSLYSAAIELPEGTTTYKAIVTDGSHDSAVTSAAYTVKKLTATWSVTDGAEVYPGSKLTVTTNADAAKIFIDGAEATSYTIPETAAIGSEITLSAYATVEADNATVTSENATITVKVAEQPTKVIIDTKFFGSMTQAAYKAYTTEDEFATYATVMNYQNSKLYWKTSSNDGCGLIINCKKGYYIESIDMDTPSANVNVFTSEKAYTATTELASATKEGQITKTASSYSFTGTPQYVGLRPNATSSMNFVSITIHYKKKTEVKIISEDATSITVGVEHPDYILHYKKIRNDNWNNHWGSEASKAPARVAQNTTGEPLADSEDWVSTGTNTITIDKTIADHQNRHYKFTAFHKDDTALANELNHVNFFIDGDGTLTGIEGIGAEAGADAPAEYYDLQGRHVANPVSGLYIRRTGSKVEKVFVK